MSDILSIQTPYADGDTVTSSNLNDLVKNATFTTAAVDNVTTQLVGGAITVGDTSITKQKLAAPLQGLIELVGTSYIGGDKTGNTRGVTSLDIQATRGSSLTSVASGNASIAIGNNCTSSGTTSFSAGTSSSATNSAAIAIGNTCTSSGDSAISLGTGNTASGETSTSLGTSNTSSGQNSIAIGKSNTSSDFTGGGSLAVGTSNTASGQGAVAIGKSNNSSGTLSTAIGTNVGVSSTYSSELGIWANSTTRNVGLKLTYDGGIALTCENRASAPSDQATVGAEDINQLGRSMFTIQRNGDAFTLYFNDAGTIKSLSLGTVS